MSVPKLFVIIESKSSKSISFISLFMQLYKYSENVLALIITIGVEWMSCKTTGTYLGATTIV